MPSLSIHHLNQEATIPFRLKEPFSKENGCLISISSVARFMPRKMFTFNSSPTPSSRGCSAFLSLNSSHQPREDKRHFKANPPHVHSGDIVRCRRNNNFGVCRERRQTKSEEANMMLIWKADFATWDGGRRRMMKQDEKKYWRKLLLFLFPLFSFFSGSGFSIDILFFALASAESSAAVCFHFNWGQKNGKAFFSFYLF